MASLESTSQYRGARIRVVTTYLPVDDLTEIIVYVTPPGEPEQVATEIPHHTSLHVRSDAMGHDIGKFWVDERQAAGPSG